jgi:two-component sensor histidine kinase
VIFDVITERQQAALALRQSLDEKVALLEEVHHRVKNNLQIVSSLLSLQASRVPNPEVLAALQDTRNRVHAMALLHEVLYRSDNVAGINFADYVGQLIKHLRGSYGMEAVRIKVENRIAPIGLPMEVSVPCGLIVTELVSNALKHAFPGEGAGTVTVSLDSSPGDRLVLRVSDDGVGVPDNLDPKNAITLGLRLVHRLASQLGGQLTVDHSGGLGTAFAIILHGTEAVATEDDR